MKKRFVFMAAFLVISALAVSQQQVAYGQITSPRNNTFLVAGSDQEITWTVGRDTTSLVLLQFSTDDGRTWSPIATIGIAAGSYDWVIPVGINSYRCKVRMMRFNGARYSLLDATGSFSIATINPYTSIHAVFSHRVISLVDTSDHRFNRVQFFK